MSLKHAWARLQRVLGFFSEPKENVDAEKDPFTGSKNTKA